MKKLLTCIACLAGALMAQAQQVNGGFDETWENCYPWEKGAKTTTKYGTTPKGWTVSNVPNKMMGQVAAEENHEEGLALVLTNQSVMGQSAPAYVTLGTTWATAETKAANVRNADGGSFGGVSFSYRPDGLRFSYKKDMSQGEERSSVIAYIWTGTWSQADVPSNTAVGVFSYGSATKVTMTDRERNILGITTPLGGTITASSDALKVAVLEQYIEGSASEWTTFEAMFDYGENAQVDLTNAKLNIIISANDYFADKSTIVSGNALTIDDVELVYNSQLSALKVGGVPVPGFDKDVYAYTATTPYSEGCITAEKNCVGGSCTIGAYDELSGTVTITVKGDDWSVTNRNEHTYVVTFPQVEYYTRALTVCINGVTAAPQTTTIKLIKEVDGSHSFELDNFMFVAGEDVLPVGNIRLTNLTVSGDIFTTDQQINITAGDLESVPADEWFGPLLGDVPVVLHAERNGDDMIANIDIDMSSLIGQLIKVVLAPEVTLTGTEAPTVLGWQNVTLTRSFKAGWNTLCLPFDFSVHAFGTDDSGENIARAQAFIATGANGLTFSEVTELEANKPYLIYFAQDTSSPVYFGVNVTSLTPVAVTQGDFTFVGTYAETQMEGKYGVVNIDDKSYIRVGDAGSVLNSTRAYFTTTLPGIKEMPLLLGGEVDAIESVPTASAVAGYDVLTLTGVQVRKGAVSLKGLPKGLYIVNGKKQIVK